MTKDEALRLALNALIECDLAFDECKDYPLTHDAVLSSITAIKEALAQPEQKYRRGDRLVCLETDEYCVIHIAGTDRQWVKFPDTHIGVYTNEQVDELFEKLAKETDTKEQEALTLALKALKPRPGMPNPEYESLMECAITAIKEALAQPEQKPFFTEANGFPQEFVPKDRQKQAIISMTDQVAALVWERDELQKQVWVYEKNGVTCQTYRHKVDQSCSECNVQMNYTTPPQRTWVGLTDEQIEYYILHRLGGVATKKNLVNLIRLCESKLKEKNNA